MPIARKCARALVFGLALIGTAAAQTEIPRGGVYQADPRHTSVTFSVGHMGLSRTVGRFGAVEATLTLDAETIENSRLVAVIPVTSVDSGLADFDRFLSGGQFMDAAAYPEIRFETTRVERTGPRTARVAGDLTLHGQTHQETMDVTFNSARTHPFDGRYMTGFSAVMTIHRARYGLTAFAEMVDDAITIEIESELALPR